MDGGNGGGGGWRKERSIYNLDNDLRGHRRKCSISRRQGKLSTPCKLMGVCSHSERTTLWVPSCPQRSKGSHSPHPLLLLLFSRPTADPDPGRATAEFQTPDALIRDEACWMTFQRGSGLFVWAVNRRLINQV